MYVTRATDGIAATYPTLSHRVMPARNHHALQGFRDAGQYGSFFKVYDGGGDAAFAAKLKSRLKLPERSANT
jgi:hypothetical protein